MKLTVFFVKHPTLFWSLMAGILIAGVLAFMQMPKLEDPAVAAKQAMVIVPYPGASAHEAELKVAQVMEDELRALPNVKKVKSECQNGMVSLTVEFQMTVLLKDLEQHFDLLRRKVSDARSKLPQDCYDPIVVDDMMDVYGIFYAFTGDGYTYPELYKYAKLIRRELLAVKGVKRILIAGNRDEVINITLSKEKIARNGILTDKKRGLGPKTYLFRIGRNTALPLLGATVIAVSTFLCIYLSPDSAGEYAGDLFLVLCVSLLASWVLALTQVPMCAKSWLPARWKEGSGAQEVYSSPVHRLVRRLIGLLTGHQKATLAVAAALLALCIYGMTRVKNLFFPDFDYKQFIVECYLPPQTDPDHVRHELLEMSALLRQNPAIERVAASMGSAPAHYCLVRPMSSGGDCYGELMVDCKDYATVVEQIPAVRKLLRERYPDTYIRIRKYNFSISTSHTVEVEFTGPDPAVLRRLSRQAEDIMRRCPYVDPYSVENNWKPRSKALVAEYVREDALRSGIERSDVANALLAATDGMPVGILTDQDRTVLINLMVRNADGSRITDLHNIPVWSMLNLRMTDEDLQAVMTGSKGMDDIQDNLFRSVPLGNVARDIRLDWEENFVYRINGQRAIEAECDPNAALYDATPAKVVASIQQEIEAIPLPAGYHMRWVGEGELQGEAIGNLMKYLPLTLFIILTILLLLFNSWKKVALILLCFPFVFCGITPALLVFRQPFTFMAIIGMMGLIGMMVKNAIVLVDEINRLQTQEHRPPYQAVVDATVSRVRPVLMASLTTIVGMIPLVGDPMYGSMAITIMGGLTVGTLITLVLLPVFYTLLFKVRKTENPTLTSLNPKSHSNR